MLFTLIGGVLADRHDRRRTLLASQYIQMATAATLGVLVVLRRRRDLAHPGAVVRHRPGAGVRRAGVSVADSVARRQEGSAERRRAQLDPVQRRARARPARLRRHARRRSPTGASTSRRRWRLLPAQRAVVSRRDLRADVAAREAHPAHRHDADARRAAGRAVLRARITAAWSRSSCSPRRRRSSASAVLTFLPLFTQQVFHEGAGTYSHLLAFSGAGSVVGALVVAWLGKFHADGADVAAGAGGLRPADRRLSRCRARCG